MIPGFYFDVEKGKYFKISTSHSAPPSQAKYTLQNVSKMQKKAAAERVARQQQEKRERETIGRPHTRNKWELQMANLDREIGGRRKTYYTHGVWPGACVAGMGEMKTVCVGLRIACYRSGTDSQLPRPRFKVLYSDLFVLRLSSNRRMALFASSIATRIPRPSTLFMEIMLSGDADEIRPAAYQSQNPILIKTWELCLYQTECLSAPLPLEA